MVRLNQVLQEMRVRSELPVGATDGSGAAEKGKGLQEGLWLAQRSPREARYLVQYVSRLYTIKSVLRASIAILTLRTIAVLHRDKAEP